MYIAHKSEDGRRQSVSAHSKQTAELCSAFAPKPWRELFYEIGLTHDIGKYQNGFQKRICGDKSVKAPHALCGAKFWKDTYGGKIWSVMAQYVIAGHHSGLPDYGTAADSKYDGTLVGTLKRECEDYSAYADELPTDKKNFDEIISYLTCGCTTETQAAERFAFLTRYCYSCLTDADWLNTEHFCTGRSRESLTADFGECLSAVNERLAEFSCETELQKARARLQRQVFDKVDRVGDVFLMNMPTGSGKTLAAAKFALERAIATDKRRIIYICSFNSIIDQTAQIFTDVFGDKAQILRHQSSFDPDSDSGEVDPLTIKLATENWDARIILTTAVQFFESVYSNRRGKLRKLHNMADSILIFDEAHLMPAEYLRPCLQAVYHITKFLGSEAVFLTATMPDYHKLFSDLTESELAVTELIDDTSDFKYFQKCSYNYAGEMSDEDILCRCRESDSTLIVVNTRSAAKKLYTMLAQSCARVYHLSTYMTAVDRMRVISAVKDDLIKLRADYPSGAEIPEERRVILVSTSLIEAGVDLDFGSVYRELFGLDSVVQAGGRCNREGKRDSALVTVFERSERRGRAVLPEVDICRAIMQEYSDITSPECIMDYYRRRFAMYRDQWEKNSISAGAKKWWQIPFRLYANNFKIIDDRTETVIVDEDAESHELIACLRRGDSVNFRALSKHGCSVYESELADLIKQGVIEEIKGIFVLTNSDYYDENTGIGFVGKDIIF